MPWRVGIDEAGYGPNFGPLVMTAVACRVPDALVEENLWRALKPAVRKHTCKSTKRLLVDDSKLVYSTARGIGDLETSVLSILQGANETLPPTIAQLVDGLHGDHELGGEPWYAGKTVVPLTIEPATIAKAAGRFRETCDAAQVIWTMFRCVIVCPPRFNAWLDQWGTKGTILSVGLVQLLNAVQALEPAEPINIVVDKHGGRNAYGAMLQEAFADGWVTPIEEGMESSVYGVQNRDRLVRVKFCPRADSGHFEVALASMISKYVREALMAEFNAFWKQHVPDLEPTAGYPGDSERFLVAIRPALARLQIAEELVWRKR